MEEALIATERLKLLASIHPACKSGVEEALIATERLKLSLWPLIHLYRARGGSTYRDRAIETRKFPLQRSFNGYVEEALIATERVGSNLGVESGILLQHLSRCP